MDLNNVMNALRSRTLIRLLFLLGYLYLNGMWLGVVPRVDILKDTCVKEIELRTQNMIIL